MLSTEEIEGAITNRSAFDRVFGGWSSFHDSLLLALRLVAVGRQRGVRLEADFELPAAWETRADGFHYPANLHRVSLAFHDVAEIALDDFLEENIVGELRLVPASSGEARRPMRVVLEAIAGCGGGFTCVCGEIEVVRVGGPVPPAA